MAEEDAGEGGKSKKLLIIIILVLLLLAGGGAALYFFLSPQPGETRSGDRPSQEEIEEDISASTEKETAKLSDPVYTPPKEYTVNLRDGRHFLNVTIVAALEDPKALVFLTTREPIIDDMIISLLGNLTSDDLRTPSGRALLKREIYKKINSVYTQEFIDDSKTRDSTPVKKILFTKFILN